MRDALASSDMSLGDTATTNLPSSVLEGSDVTVVPRVLGPCSR